MGTALETIAAAIGPGRDIKTKRRYELVERFGQNIHNWYIESGLGVVHLHITDSREEGKPEDWYSRVYGGIEIHKKTPPEGREYDAPDHKGCYLLKCDCWADGTSVGAEGISDFFKSEPTGGKAKLPGVSNHEPYFAELMRWAEGRILPPFASEEDEK